MESKIDTQLELKEYFFPVVQVVATPNAGEADENFEFKVKVSLSENENEEGEIYQVIVDIESVPEEGEREQQYAFHLVAVGLFTVNPAHPNISKLLYINGSSILYGAAREFLITVTSRGPWPPVSLPSISFLSKYQEEVEAQEKDIAQDDDVGVVK